MEGEVMAQGITINDNCVNLIKRILPDGGTILEFGSGEGTTWLSDAGYKMYSVENQSEWMDKYPNDLQDEHKRLKRCFLVSCNFF